MRKVERVLFSIVAVILLVSVFLCGCASSENTKKKLFDAMKENGLFSFDCEYEDYDEKRSVDQSPIPKNIIYYDYRVEETTYTIDYGSRILGDNDSVYFVRVTTKREEQKSTTDVYYFEKETFEFREKK